MALIKHDIYIFYSSCLALLFQLAWLIISRLETRQNLRKIYHVSCGHMIDHDLIYTNFHFSDYNLIFNANILFFLFLCRHIAENYPKLISFLGKLFWHQILSPI